MTNLILYCPTCGLPLVYDYDCENSHKCANCRYKLKGSNTIDISFKSKGLAKALSNLCPYPFEFDGVKCFSMESFIQSLKVKDMKMQEDVCSKTGPFCYSIREMFEDWRETGTVYWKGKAIYRHGGEYFELLTNAYEELFYQSPIFQYALKKVEESEFKLIHSIGCDNPKETLLTPNEFIAILNHLIDYCIYN